MWPASGKTTKRLSGIASWAAWPCLSGMIESCSPQTISVGQDGGEVEAVVGADALARRRRSRRGRCAGRPGGSRCCRGWRSRCARTAMSPLGAIVPALAGRRRRRGRRSETPTEVSTGRTQSAPGQGGGAQEQVDLLAEAAAGDQPETLAALGELVGELHRDPAAERVADDRHVLVAESGQQVAHAARVGAERVVPAWAWRSAPWPSRSGAMTVKCSAELRSATGSHVSDEFAIPCRSSEDRAAAGRPVGHRVPVQCNLVALEVATVVDLPRRAVGLLRSGQAADAVAPGPAWALTSRASRLGAARGRTCGGRRACRRSPCA